MKRMGREAVLALLVAVLMVAGVGVVGFGQGATTVSYSGDIQPIFTENCTSCHGGERGSGGLILEEGVSYDNIVNVARRGTEEDENPFMRIAPGLPEASYLLHKVLGTQNIVGGRGSQMPLGGGGPLSDEDINLLRTWILEGAQNN